MSSRPQDGRGRRILFGHVQEDTSLEASLAFGARALCICSGGETAFDLLLGGAKDVVSIDINPAQALLVHFKSALFRYLPSSEINDAMTKDARPAFIKLKSRLPQEVTEYFAPIQGEISQGLIHCGQIDRGMRIAMKLFQRFVHSRKKLVALIEKPTIQQQADYFNVHWRTPRTQLGLNLAFSSFILKRMFGPQLGGLAPKAFGDQVRRDLETVLTTVPLEDNPYVWQTFFGEYPPGGLPGWLTPFGHSRMAQVISRLGIEVGDVTEWMMKQPEPQLNLVCLSNVLELSKDPDKLRLIEAFERAVAPGGLVVARSLFDREIGLDKLSAGRLKRVEISGWTDRSLLCRYVEVYRWATP